MTNWDYNKIQKHTIDALDQSVVNNNNFEWISIVNLFPADYYNYLINLDNKDLSQEVLEVFDNEDFVKLLYRKFANSKKRSNTISSIYTFWQVAGSGYSLKPHVDSYPRVFTMTLYFPQDNNNPQAGTAIYDVDYNTREYQTLAVSPFLKNSCKIIAPYDDVTWHGVNLLHEDIQRKSVVCVFSDQEWNKQQLHYADWKPGRTVSYGV